MNNTKLLVIGGFLGAGKTTTILSLAKLFLNSGKKIGIVTNDQGSDLVDTNFLLKEGLPVLEVTGGCFCCNFDEFNNKVKQLQETEMPDIILAEPVGSCTDLVATIFKPMQYGNTTDFALCPFCVVADPKRVKRLMVEKSGSPFPNEINYLFSKQLEEANIIVLSKIDKYKDSEIEELKLFLENEYKGTTVVLTSCINNIGITNLVENVFASDLDTLYLKELEEINYEKYGDAEAFLGWFNGTSKLNSDVVIDYNIVLKELMEEICAKLNDTKNEIAHLKVYAVSDVDFCKASLTANDDEVSFNKKMNGSVKNASLIINARVSIDPIELTKVITESSEKILIKHGINYTDFKLESFKPGKPTPKYGNRV